MNLIAHAQMLALSRGIKVERQANAVFRAYPDRRRRIVVGPTLDEAEYYSVLHEIGHVALNHDDDRRGQAYVLRTEVEAWVWALENGKAPVTRAVAGLIRQCLMSYGAKYGCTAPSSAALDQKLQFVEKLPARATARRRLP